MDRFSNKYQLIFVLIILSLIGWSLAVGRNPTAVEHNACRVKWSEHVNEIKKQYKDDRTTIRAINVSFCFFIFCVLNLPFEFVIFEFHFLFILFNLHQRGLDGSPCMTSCRIIYRGNVKDMEDIYTPDDVQCATGPYPRVNIQY